MIWDWSGDGLKAWTRGLEKAQKSYLCSDHLNHNILKRFLWLYSPVRPKINDIAPRASTSGTKWHHPEKMSVKNGVFSSNVNTFVVVESSTTWLQCIFSKKILTFQREKGQQTHSCIHESTYCKCQNTQKVAVKTLFQLRKPSRRIIRQISDILVRRWNRSSIIW